MPRQEYEHQGLPYSIDDDGEVPKIAVQGRPVEVARDAGSGTLHTPVLPYSTFSAPEELAKAVIDAVYAYKKT